MQRVRNTNNKNNEWERMYTNNNEFHYTFIIRYTDIPFVNNTSMILSACIYIECVVLVNKDKVLNPLKYFYTGFS